MLRLKLTHCMHIFNYEKKNHTQQFIALKGYLWGICDIWEVISQHYTCEVFDRGGIITKWRWGHFIWIIVMVSSSIAVMIKGFSPSRVLIILVRCLLRFVAQGMLRHTTYTSSIRRTNQMTTWQEDSLDTEKRGWGI